MRQAGILAAAGIVALESMVDRLKQDHDRARNLAEGLQALPAISIEQNPPPTNMFYMNLEPDAGVTTHDLIERLEKDGIKLTARYGYRMRLVTHYWIDDAAIERTIDGFARAVTAL